MTSNVLTSSVDDTAKDAMDTSLLYEDDLSPGYTPQSSQDAC